MHAIALFLQYSLRWPRRALPPRHICIFNAAAMAVACDRDRRKSYRVRRCALDGYRRATGKRTFCDGAAASECATAAMVTSSAAAIATAIAAAFKPACRHSSVLLGHRITSFFSCVLWYIVLYIATGRHKRIFLYFRLLSYINFPAL